MRAWEIDVNRKLQKQLFVRVMKSMCNLTCACAGMRHCLPDRHYVNYVQPVLSLLLSGKANIFRIKLFGRYLGPNYGT